MKQFLASASCGLCLWVSPALSSEPAAIIDAVRSGDAQAVKRLLGRGTNINVRDDTGASALMHSTVYADEHMVSMLLKHGADVNAENNAKATALMWSVKSPAKAKLLIDHGADVNAVTEEGLTPLIMAAVLPDSAETVRLLLKHGAEVNANSQNFSPLMAASSRGDVEVVKLLLENGADATKQNSFGFSPLHGASFNGTAETTRLLLAKGVNPNVEVVGLTPTVWAAVHGKTEALKLLVAAGGKVNIQQGEFYATPLLWASTTGHFDTIEFLLNNGADVEAKDNHGNTPLTWAKRRGSKKIIALLEKAGATDPAPKVMPRHVGVDESKSVTKAAIRGAVEKSLPLLQRTGPAFIANGEGCVSCHHQSLPAMALGLARHRGFKINEGIATEQRQAVLDQLDEQRENLLQGFGVVDVLDPAYFLTGLAAEGQERNRAIDAAVTYLVGRQRKDGSWKNIQHRPPLQQSDMVNTALGIRCLQVYGLPGRSNEMEHRIKKARTWLESQTTSLPADAALRLLGLRWGNAKSAVLRVAADDLVSRQRRDGGWAQLPSLASGSYATGIALVALHEAGVAIDSPVYERGLKFLLGTQLEDGSWFVQTRSFPVQEYFDTEFPHEQSQFISTAATAWSTMALLHACQHD